MGRLLGTLLALAVDTIIRPAAQAAQARAAIHYIDEIRKSRKTVITLCGLLSGFVLMASGAILMPLAFCVFMPWAPQTKAIVAAAFGALYLLIPVIVISVFMSEKRWMQMTQADQLLKDSVVKR